MANRTFTRRTALKGLAAASATTLALPAYARSRPIKLGFVTPQTGPLAIFAEPDGFVLDQVRRKLANGLMVQGVRHEVEIIVKDSQSSSNRAASVAQELIFDDEVDILMATSTPDTTNPVADQAELNEVPCITNDTPWQPHFFGRQGDPNVGFEWTYHFFWGLEDIVSTFTGMWGQLETDKVVGALWPNDPDGNAWGDPNLGFPPALAQQGFELVDTGRFQNMTDDFSSQIAAFKKAGVDIVTGVVIPPDFTTFWTQAAQQGFTPKVATVAKASEFPQAVGTLGERAHGLSVEVWWSPDHPFASGMTGQSSADLAAAYEAATGNPWTMPLGFKHALFEVGLDALSRAESLEPAAIRDAIAATRYGSVVGPIDFSAGPVPNVAKTPLVGGQWRMEGGKPVLQIVEPNNTGIDASAEMFAISTGA
ncbi:ABC transporter substrate-binding protein [Pseudaestuariivita sp.]|uniref:ABC transporter substrate-binding protein n=1 Tax=Pseudaestuariivita sp. TaxID=2211669 RepID=UPI00405918ED